ncbi:hypothetical protein [Rhodococcus sp. 14C212]|uniref:hypothetical protein n=1 Tax=Rhodococcus sp. 14C212 TaxID=2711209 RepID=UPI003211DC15
MTDGDLLVDPAMTPDGFGCDDRADAVLNEETRTDSVRFESQRGGGSVQRAKQHP